MTTEERALRDYLADPVAAARERKRVALDGYDHAVAGWRAAREAGDIVEETDSRERSMGVKYRATSPAGKAALAFFAVRKAELDGAEELLRYELGRQAERDQGEGDAADFGTDGAA